MLDPTRLKPIIVRLPKDRGITGIAIAAKKVQVVHNGDYNVSYAAEVDNSIGLAVVKNCLIGPCFDTQGQLRGLIQLVNKLDVEPISMQDEREFANLLPTVAEMIKQADEVKYVGDLASNVHLHLHRSKEAIFGAAKVFEERDVATIYSALNCVVNRMDSFMEQKRKNTLKENFLSN